MTVTKGEVRLAAFHEAGCQLDDQLDRANQDVYRAEGGIAASQEVTKRIQSLAAHVNKDVEEGRYTLEIAKVAQIYLSRAAVVADAYTKEQADLRQRCIGAATGLKRGVAAIQSLHAAEVAKADAAIVESGRPRSSHMSIKQQRLQAAPIVTSGEEMPGPPPETPTPTAVPSQAKSNGTRGRGGGVRRGAYA